MALVLAVAHSSPAQIEDLEQTRAAAEAGDPEAQYNLAVLYRYAVTVRGVEFAKRPRRCRNWLRLAAEKGNPDAQLALAVSTSTASTFHRTTARPSSGTPSQPSKGTRSPSGGLAFSITRGTAKYPSTTGRPATGWNTPPAKVLPRLKARLGWMFFTGEAGQKDLAKAYAWMSLGAFGGDQGSFGWKDKIKTQMTADELTQALQLAAQLWRNTKRPNFR